MNAPKKSIDVIINYIKRKPEEWHLDEFYLKHKSGLKIWIGNGFTNYHITKPNYQELTWTEKFRLRKAINSFNKIF